MKAGETVRYQLGDAHPAISERQTRLGEPEQPHPVEAFIAEIDDRLARHAPFSQTARMSRHLAGHLHGG